jgi:hypothetical protein
MVEGRPKRAGDLKRAIREVRIAHAERNDVLVELRDAEQARLEILADALEGVFDDLPPGHEQLLLGILPGNPPRFWVDATSFVMMGRDKRLYQFLKDTRMGRTMLAENTSVDAIADAVTRYVAERIVEREQGIESDWLMRASRRRRGVLAGTEGGARKDNIALVWGLCGFGLGMIAGVFLLVAHAWVMAG